MTEDERAAIAADLHAIETELNRRIRTVTRQEIERYATMSDAAVQAELAQMTAEQLKALDDAADDLQLEHQIQHATPYDNLRDLILDAIIRTPE